MMKHSTTLLLTIFLTLVFAACKMGDVNGDLDGMWQLTSVYDKATGDTLKDKNDGFFICVQQDLMKFQKANTQPYYLARFALNGDRLVISQPHYWPSDTLCPMSRLLPYGIPEDGILQVGELSSSRMVLSSDAVTISLRKY